MWWCGKINISIQNELRNRFSCDVKIIVNILTGLCSLHPKTPWKFTNQKTICRTLTTCKYICRVNQSLSKSSRQKGRTMIDELALTGTLTTKNYDNFHIHSRTVDYNDTISTMQDGSYNVSFSPLSDLIPQITSITGFALLHLITVFDAIYARPNQFCVCECVLE